MQSTNETIYYEFGNFRLDVAQETLLKNGKPVTLTHKAFQTLLILVRNSGKIVEKDDLIAQIWTDSFVEESNLSQYIYLLRKILGTDEEGNVYIETITKRGFRFSAPVTEVKSLDKSITEVPDLNINNDNFPHFGNGTELGINGNGHNHFTQISVPEIPQSINNGSINNLQEDSLNNSTTEKVFSGNGKLWLGLALPLIFVLGFAAVYIYNNRQTPRRAVNQTTKSIAVLPFKTIGEESSNEKLGLGMADALITRIGRAKQIPVRPTSAISQFTDASPIDSSEVVGGNLR
jgi:DNA-binding winged helix-turn-helix (wHTH) protein